MQQINGKPYVRLLQPFVVAEECLKCHEQQGYSVGDLRGGIGIKLPLEPFAVVEQAHKVLLIGSHGGIWLFGLLGMGFWFRRERKRDIELRQASAQLQHQAHHDPLPGCPTGCCSPTAWRWRWPRPRAPGASWRSVILRWLQRGQ